MFGNGEGLRAESILEKEGINTNMTALMSVNQAIIRESMEILDKGNFKTKIIVGSIRNLTDVPQAAIAGAHVLTIPYKILAQMSQHPKTEETIKEFDSAWLEFKKAEGSGMR